MCTKLPIIIFDSPLKSSLGKGFIFMSLVAEQQDSVQLDPAVNQLEQQPDHVRPHLPGRCHEVRAEELLSLVSRPASGDLVEVHSQEGVEVGLGCKLYGDCAIWETGTLF